MKKILQTSIVMFYLGFVASAADYFPLVVGNEWHYSYETEDMEGAQSSMAIAKTSVIDSDTIFHVAIAIDMSIYSDTITGYLTSDGNDLLTFDSLTEAKPYDKAFEHHPVEGHEWSWNDGQNRKIVYYGTITVAAGTFTSCYAAEVDNTSSEVYAPDVGVVAAIQDGEISMQLVSYNVAPVEVIGNKHKHLITRHNGVRNDIQPSAYFIVNAQGRRVTQGNIIENDLSGQTLSSGIYFIRSESCRDRVIQRCFTRR